VSIAASRQVRGCTAFPRRAAAARALLEDPPMNKLTIICVAALGLVLGAGCGSSKCKASGAKITRTDKDVMDAYNALGMGEFAESRDKLRDKLGAPDACEADGWYWYGVKPKDEWGPQSCVEIELKEHSRQWSPTDGKKCGLTP
jgi:hypothetical protein